MTGTVFEVVNGSNTITTLASFNGANGQSPGATWLRTAAAIPGTAALGGANGDGTVFGMWAYGARDLHRDQHASSGAGSLRYEIGLANTAGVNTVAFGSFSTRRRRSP